MNKERIEMELAGELREMIALGWGHEDATENREEFFKRIGDYYTSKLTEDDILRVWENVWGEFSPLYKIRDDVDISLLGSHASLDMRFTRDMVEEDAANFEMDVDEYISEFLEEV